MPEQQYFTGTLESGPPTQTQHPWHATARTVFAAFVAILPLLPSIADALGVTAVPVVASILLVAAAVTRALALPSVNAWLQRFVPFLSATPKLRPAERVDGAYQITIKANVDTSALDSAREELQKLTAPSVPDASGTDPVDPPPDGTPGPGGED